MRRDPQRRRKPSRLRGFDDTEGRAYFVTICTQDRECRFGEVIADRMRLNKAGEMVARWWRVLPSRFPRLRLDEWQVMTNHLHGILVLPGPAARNSSSLALSEVIGWFKTMTTNAYIRGVKSDGWPEFRRRIWQRTYHDRIVRDETELRKIRDYIVTNPLKWHLDRENPAVEDKSVLAVGGNDPSGPPSVAARGRELAIPPGRANPGGNLPPAMPRNLFSVAPEPSHGEVPGVGVLLIQLGTPDAPTPRALRSYLKQFLWDPRVIELPRPLWWLILNLFVLPSRPRASARLYRNIWTEDGSPLLIIARNITAAVGARLDAAYGTPIHTALGMTYGSPSIPEALADLKAAGCRRIVVLPLFSHYSSSSTGAAFDAVMSELVTWRWVPEVRTINHFHDEPALIRALARTVREHWAEHGEPDLLVTSYHGTPERYLRNGDPYHCHCHKTSRLLAGELGLTEDRWRVTFQSRFGREPWLQPYTDVTLEELARSGTGRVDVICPGFRIDCLETLDEIDREYRHAFLRAGGEEFHYIPCLNDRPEHVHLFVDLLRRNLHGWVESRETWSQEGAEAEAARTRRLADAMVRERQHG